MIVTRWAVLGFAVVTLAGTPSPAQTQAPAPEKKDAAAAAPRPRMARGPRVTSPEIAPDGQVTFRILAPKAQSVRLMGDIPSDGPAIPMQPPAGRALTQGAEGVWAVSVRLAPGAWRYSFDVDGVTVIDPRNPRTSESNENTWSLVHVPGAAFMDTKAVPHGAVASVTYYSTALSRFRRMHVYTPPGYETSGERYPVFYLLHGAMDCDDSWWTVGRAGFILDNLIAAGQAKPMIVVMPAGHTGPMSFTPGAPRPAVDEFQADFRTDVVPYVEKTYRVLSGRGNRALAGLSMGGAQTLGIGIPDLDKYGYLGVFSSGVFGITGRGSMPMPPGPSFEEQNAKTLDDPALKKELKLVWFATGKDDFLLETSRATVAMLKKHGFEVAYKESEGAHTWTNWREYLCEFAPQLFR